MVALSAVRLSSTAVACSCSPSRLPEALHLRFSARARAPHSADDFSPQHARRRRVALVRRCSRGQRPIQLLRWLRCRSAATLLGLRACARSSVSSSSSAARIFRLARRAAQRASCSAASCCSCSARAQRGERGGALHRHGVRAHLNLHLVRAVGAAPRPAPPPAQ